MPSSCATCVTARLLGGSNFFNTASLRSIEYRDITVFLRPPSTFHWFRRLDNYPDMAGYQGEDYIARFEDTFGRT